MDNPILGYEGERQALETLREELITLVENAINKGLTSDDVAFELADLAKTVNSYDR